MKKINLTSGQKILAGNIQKPLQLSIRYTISDPVYHSIRISIRELIRESVGGCMHEPILYSIVKVMDPDYGIH